MSGDFNNIHTSNLIPSSSKDNLSFSHLVSPYSANSLNPSYQFFLQNYSSHINMNNLAFSLPYQQFIQQQQQDLQQNNFNLQYQFPFLYSLQNQITKANNQACLSDMVTNIMKNQSNANHIQPKCKFNKEHPKASSTQSLEALDIQKVSFDSDNISNFEMEKNSIYQ